MGLRRHRQKCDNSQRDSGRGAAPIDPKRNATDPDQHTRRDVKLKQKKRINPTEGNSNPQTTVSPGIRGTGAGLVTNRPDLEFGQKTHRVFVHCHRFIGPRVLDVVGGIGV